MGKEVLMPKLGLTMTKGKIVQWKKKEGDRVQEGEDLVIIETEKITTTVKSPVSGILLKIYAKEGEEVPVGQIIAYIGEIGEQPPPSPTKPALATQQQQAQPIRTEEVKVIGEVRASPRARRLAKEKGIDLSKIRGTGPGGMITEDDVIRELENIEKGMKFTATGLRVKEVIPMSVIRQEISRRMVQSLQTMAQVTLSIEINANSLVKMKNEIESKYSMKITYTDILVKVVAKLLRDHPYLNATLEGDQIKIIEEVNIGIAVALDQGLIVPVIRNADTKPITEIAKESHELADKARENKLNPDEVSGGTFTISNLGMYDIDSFTPIINPPQTAILGVGRIRRAPVVVGDNISIGYIMWLSLTFDHRVMDGHTAAKFLKELTEILEDENKLRTFLS
ncbi:2-oxo acid dehydrogenase subunit E2 [Saccharolobus solfataricus]|nr:dihydrolipoamide acetyltransferase family protein [Saccharolobus solfataricus]AKA74545.1 2-oxo acid dehydrogenase subunit E2 [Saccharolobus solfataricus]AKA77241.1 2-oxo acid dehydrogenase subunit E2 [Saccharolobus solfataricus]AKA79933.1 2-oxo acid dehydrogenase subunit E2 [Saccharolobus solfataricus]AZF69019.1 2-oxo acid dehydrogenase subunit E2 [Saccharolobus solfataricus]AZF71639.1 2-oxo acid dehydrogenase subunit E2 [Saccharolobus solfataricus]